MSIYKVFNVKLDRFASKPSKFFSCVRPLLELIFWLIVECLSKYHSYIFLNSSLLRMYQNKLERLQLHLASCSRLV